MIWCREDMKKGNCFYVNELELIHHLPVCVLNRVNSDSP